MLILVLIFAIACLIIYDFTDNDGIEILGIMVGFVDIGVIIFMTLSYPYKINEKMIMYEEENTKIEEKVKDTVRAYMKYEEDTYNNLVKDTDLETLLVAYPDLNSNELVKSEIELYAYNNHELKKLKEQKINRSVFRWWLYFGK